MTLNKIQLYSSGTSNGQKIGIALEEMGLEYDAHTIHMAKGEQFTPEFLAVTPSNKIPSITDPNGTGGKAFNVFERGAILLCLAEKSGGKFLPSDPALKSETIQWLMFQMGGVGPMLGQFAHFSKFAKDKCDPPHPVERYTTEAKRLLGVLEKRLERRDFLIDAGYTIADMATFPWIAGIKKFRMDEQLELAKVPNVLAWTARCEARPATARGSTVCSN